MILRRDKKLNTSSYVDFNRSWIDYETGFGDLETEFWYGLREMHCLTQEDVDMRLDITYTNGTSIVWTYGLFKVDGPETNYRLHIGEAVGSSGAGRDAMIVHTELPFSTRDRDNAKWRYNCAAANHGGWWWKSCGDARLTSGGWYNDGSYIPVSFVEMKIRLKSCHAAPCS